VTRAAHGALLVALIAAGCGLTTTYTKSSTSAWPARPADCPLETLTVPPQRSFIELGTFDFRPRDQWHILHSVSEVVEQVRARACAEGADAIIAKKNDFMYTQATLLRWAPGEPAAPSPPPAAGPASPSNAPVAPGSASPASPSAQ
jgi:hypothetical protein